MAWHRFITHNLGWKIVSVLLASLLWALVHLSRLDTLRFGERKPFDAVPVQVLTPAADGAVFHVDPRSVSLTVSGAREPLQQLRLSDVLAFVNPGDIPEDGAYRDVEVYLPAGISLHSLVPNQVRVSRAPAQPQPPPPADP